MPFSLVYGVDDVLPIEVEIPTLRISMKGLITDDDYRISQLQELELLDERWQVGLIIFELISSVCLEATIRKLSHVTSNWVISF